MVILVASRLFVFVVFLCSRVVPVHADMVWSMLNNQLNVVKVFFGDDPTANEENIAYLENITKVNMIQPKTTNDDQNNNTDVGLFSYGTVPVEMNTGYLSGNLPEPYDPPALVTGWFDFGAFGSGTILQYTYSAQAPSSDRENDWENFLQDFDWIDNLTNRNKNDPDNNYPYANNPLFATFKNYGDPPYQAAINGVPGMTSVQVCLYDFAAVDETKLGCNEQAIEEGDYDEESNSMVIDLNAGNTTLCGNNTYYVRARVKGIADPNVNMNISYYATVSSRWDNIVECPITEVLNEVEDIRDDSSGANNTDPLASVPGFSIELLDGDDESESGAAFHNNSNMYGWYHLVLVSSLLCLLPFYY